MDRPSSAQQTSCVTDLDFMNGASYQTPFITDLDFMNGEQ